VGFFSDSKLEFSQLISHSFLRVSFDTTLTVVSSAELQDEGPKQHRSLQYKALLKYSRMPISIPMFLKWNLGCNHKKLLFSLFFTMFEWM